MVYPRVDDFIELIKQKGQGCLLYKTDLRRAYRPGIFSGIALRFPCDKTHFILRRFIMANIDIYLFYSMRDTKILVLKTSC